MPSATVFIIPKFFAKIYIIADFSFIFFLCKIIPIVLK